MIIDDQILVAMVAAASASPPVGIPVAELERYEDIKLDDTTPKRSLFYSVEDDEGPEGDDDNSPLQLHVMTVGVRQCALGTTTTTPAQEAGKIHAWNVKALSNQSFGGLATYCRPFKRRWIRPKDPVNRKQIELVTLWRVKFSSRAGDAELAA